MNREHEPYWEKIEDVVPKKSHDMINMLSDFGMLDICEVNSFKTWRINMHLSDQYSFGSEEIDRLRRIFGKKADINCYNNTSDGNTLVSMDYQLDDQEMIDV